MADGEATSPHAPLAELSIPPHKPATPKATETPFPSRVTPNAPPNTRESGMSGLTASSHSTQKTALAATTPSSTATAPPAKQLDSSGKRRRVRRRRNKKPATTAGLSDSQKKRVLSQEEMEKERDRIVAERVAEIRLQKRAREARERKRRQEEGLETPSATPAIVARGESLDTMLQSEGLNVSFVDTDSSSSSSTGSLLRVALKRPAGTNSHGASNEISGSFTYSYESSDLSDTFVSGGRQVWSPLNSASMMNINTTELILSMYFVSTKKSTGGRVQTLLNECVDEFEGLISDLTAAINSCSGTGSLLSPDSAASAKSVTATPLRSPRGADGGAVNEAGLSYVQVLKELKGVSADVIELANNATPPSAAEWEPCVSALHAIQQHWVGTWDMSVERLTRPLLSLSAVSRTLDQLPRSASLTSFPHLSPVDEEHADTDSVLSRSQSLPQLFSSAYLGSELLGESSDEEDEGDDVSNGASESTHEGTATALGLFTGVPALEIPPHADQQSVGSDRSNSTNASSMFSPVSRGSEMSWNPKPLNKRNRHKRRGSLPAQFASMLPPPEVKVPAGAQSAMISSKPLPLTPSMPYLSSPSADHARPPLSPLTEEPETIDESEEGMEVDSVMCRMCEKYVPVTLLERHVAECTDIGETLLELFRLKEELDEMRRIMSNKFEVLSTRDKRHLSKPSDVDVLSDILNQAADMHFLKSAIAPQICELLLRQLQDAKLSMHPESFTASVAAEASKVLKRLLEVLMKVMSTSTKTMAGQIEVPASMRASIDDFQIVKRISAGAFGRVFLVRKKATGDLYALKVIRKKDIAKKNNIQQVLSENRILLESSAQAQCVKLYYSFQSEENVYMVMEFLPGGDLSSLLNNFGYLEEDHARAYIAEIVLVLAWLHSRSIVHRDLKPDNLLIDKNGHLKLTDFGLSVDGLEVDHPLNSVMESHQKAKKKSQQMRASSATGLGESKETASWFENLPMTARSFTNVGALSTETSDNSIKKSVSLDKSADFATNVRKVRHFNNDADAQRGNMRHSFVGTPDYLAPEIIMGKGHSFEVDYWALGVVAYEMIMGVPPFNDQSIELIFGHILRRDVAWPDDDEMSPEARDLIDKLLTIDPAERLGSKGAEEVKAHPFFEGFDWDNCLKEPSLFFLPQINDTDGEDTSYFIERAGPESIGSGGGGGPIGDGENISQIHGLFTVNVDALTQATRDSSASLRSDSGLMNAFNSPGKSSAKSSPRSPLVLRKVKGSVSAATSGSSGTTDSKEEESASSPFLAPAKRELE